MGWDDNNYDWMDSGSGGGFSDDGGGMDFGPNQDAGVNWNFGSESDGFDFGGQSSVGQQYPDWLQNSVGGTQQYPMSQPAGGMPQIQQQTPTGGTNSFLSQLFSNPNQMGGLLGKGIAALFEGGQNKKMASSMNRIASNPALDPFGSQRPIYQQALQSTMNDPYSQPIVRNQVDQLQRAQAIKDAAAGRRSNSLTSAPGVLAAQAEIAQKYMNSLMSPAGANLGPNGGSIAQALMNGAKYDANGYSSPLANVFGYGNQQSNNNEMLMQQMTELLKGRQQ